MRLCIRLKLIVLALALPLLAQTQPAARNFDRWEKEIATIERQNRDAPKGGVVFIGSSTIKRWKTLAQDFPDAPVINAGFGGSEIVDATHFVDRIVAPYEPAMVVLRSGGNDIHAGKTPQQVFANYKDFVAKVREKLPDATIVFIGLSPAPVRWKERDANKQLNTLVEEFTRQNKGLKYVESYDMTVDAAGEPRKELFVADQLHFNAEGYKLLVERVRPIMPAKKK